MNHRIVGFLLCLLALVGCARKVRGQRPPNVIVILADDLGWRELGCYGNRFNETPHLDQLARSGMRFTQAYATAPVCTPTRIALMTGQHPARVGITDYLDANDEKFLSPDYVTLNEQLQKVGYHSGLIGKWHLTGDYAKKKGEPAKQHWDEVICSETGYIANGDYVHPYFFMPDVTARTDNEYLTDRLNTEAVEFIRRNRAKPFFFTSLTTPSTPNWPVNPTRWRSTGKSPVPAPTITTPNWRPCSKASTTASGRSWLR